MESGHIQTTDCFKIITDSVHIQTIDCFKIITDSVHIQTPDFMVDSVHIQTLDHHGIFSSYLDNKNRGGISSHSDNRLF